MAECYSASRNYACCEQYAGRKVVQLATVVTSEGSVTSSRNTMGLGGVHSDLSLSGQRSAYVRERDNVELQARLSLLSGIPGHIWHRSGQPAPPRADI